MNAATISIYLFCYLCSAGYIAFGIIQMIVPQRALPVYRFFLGKKTFSKNESRFNNISLRAWKILGAGYICFGMLVAWLLTRSLGSF